MKETQGTMDMSAANTTEKGSALTPYGPKQIGWELERTALGDGYFGSALRAAMDFSCVNPEEREVLQRYASGAQRGTDHITLQEIAIKVYQAEEKVEMDAKICQASGSTADGQEAIEEREIGWGVFYFGGKQNGKLYTHLDTEENARQYVANLHQSQDQHTFQVRPIFERLKVKR